MNRVTWLGFSLLAAMLAACQAASRPSPQATLTAPATQAPQPSAAAPVIVTDGPLSVNITSPANEAVVNTPQVVVSGTARPDVVITINDTIVVVDASGQFSATVQLDEGPNDLAIQVSDAAGNETHSQLTVTYEPNS